MNVALVAIVKDEVNLSEWIAYHRKIGFNRIFLIANDWTPCILDRDIVVYNYNGIAMQIHAYNNWIARFGTEFDYAAFFDADEYLYLPGYSNVQSMLQGRSIGVNWVFFGTNVNIGQKGVVNRYLIRDDKPDRHIKSIVKMGPGVKMANPHFSNSPTFTTSGEQVIGPFAKLPVMDKAFLAHYYYQDENHWQRKLNRGRADTGSKLARTAAEWNSVDYNKVFDNRLNEFLYDK